MDHKYNNELSYYNTILCFSYIWPKVSMHKLYQWCQRIFSGQYQFNGLNGMRISHQCWLLRWFRPSCIKLRYFNQEWLSICTQNIRFLVPSSHSRHRKWDGVLQGETSIAAEVVHNLPLMYEIDNSSFWKHMSATYGAHRVISTKVDSQFAHKVSELG